MEELGKIERTIGKQDQDAPHLKLLVVDATTGSNALSQPRSLTKPSILTGSSSLRWTAQAKEAFTVAIQQELGIPTRFIGLGEEPELFKPFQKEEFINGIL